MNTLTDTPRGRNSRELQAAVKVPSVLPLLDADERTVLLRWLCGEAATLRSS
ncbi:hypothetical protein HBDW_11810 [Herbaspirillum sp. DW155]|uniref:hypothetical protein n=1 Tax=Herbaspirillum sp. DW155 TaxID=3095609 RepID=UPI00308A5980|nr:hypothetical protein HBDW_11810 [Herbaspirillum sp. DW155]